jgi:L-alanine-DL-glutamate epimerase-like enolase superfamily enzyme
VAEQPDMGESVAIDSVAIESVDVACFRVPTEAPESDGTLEWDSTTMVLVEIGAGGATGLGYTYTNEAAAVVVSAKLAEVLRGQDALSTRACWDAMVHAIRNFGRPGICSSAIAACDVALHDLKARLMGVPVVQMLGARRQAVPVYGSGGFTSSNDGELARQLGGWAAQGLPDVKMKIGREPGRDLERVRVAREAIGPDVGLFVDANGALSRKRALAFAEACAPLGVSWFEEPVSSEDIEGMRLMRDRAPATIEVTTGEYAYHMRDFRELVLAGAVDVLQADATRCAGLTGFLLADALCHAFELPLSTHTAPALHLHAACAGLQVRHMEWFHDHVRIERMFFDGAPEPKGGRVAPDLSRPGIGLELKRADAERYRI